MFKEEWKPVVGYESKYEVSNLGNIKRVYDKTCPRDKGYIGKPIKPRVNNSYIRVSLEDKSYAVHRELSLYCTGWHGSLYAVHQENNALDYQSVQIGWRQICISRVWRNVLGSDKKLTLV